MKRKILSIILCAVMLSSTICSCGVDVAMDSEKETVFDTTSATDTSVELTKATEEMTTEPPTKSESDFDFEKTIESTYICGHQLSYPPTWGQLGEDFSIDPESAFSSSGLGKFACVVKYKGQYLGIFTFKGCGTVDAITADTEISYISIGTENVDKFDVPKISVNGVELNDTHEILYEAVGNGYEISNDDYQIIYCDADSKRQYRFSFNALGTEDELVSVVINLIK